MESVDCEKDTRNEIGTRCFPRSSGLKNHGRILQRYVVFICPATLHLSDVRFIKPTSLPRVSVRIVGIVQDHIPRRKTNRTRDGMRNNSKTEWIPGPSRLRDALVLFEKAAEVKREEAEKEGWWLPLNVELVQGKNPNSRGRGRERLERLLMSVGGEPRGWVGQVRSKGPPWEVVRLPEILVCRDAGRVPLSRGKNLFYYHGTLHPPLPSLSPVPYFYPPDCECALSGADLKC